VTISVSPFVYQLRIKHPLQFSGDIQYERQDRSEDELKFRVRFKGRMIGGNPNNSRGRWPKLSGKVTLSVNQKRVSLWRDFSDWDDRRIPDMKLDWIRNARKCGYHETELLRAEIISNNPEDIKKTLCVLKKASPILKDSILTLLHVAEKAFPASSLDRDQIVQYLDVPGGKINLNSLSATESN